MVSPLPRDGIGAVLNTPCFHKLISCHIVEKSKMLRSETGLIEC